TAEVINNLRLPGQYFDAETGLHYNWYRYYSPQTGRYLQTDPLMDGLNLYSYVRSRPLMYIDPNGLCATGGNSQNQNDMNPNGFWDHIVQSILSDLEQTPNGLFYDNDGNLYQLGDDGKYEKVELYLAEIPIGPGSWGKWAAAGKRIEGIYEFVASSGKKYVGQSDDILRRLSQHIRSGKLKPSELENVKMTEVLGGKTAREVHEQLRINDLGTIRVLENVRNPIGPLRQYLMP
ncbi:MAG: hypothetical protein M0036_11035, partial [Desulfobacteraceae bacterium]|nr:hypothetical protein [Desulfobacteraceae bacterium]